MTFLYKFFNKKVKDWRGSSDTSKSSIFVCSISVLRESCKLIY